MKDLKYWVALSRIPSLGTARFRLLERYFPSLEETWRASGTELKEAGLDARTVTAILTKRGDISPDDEMERLESAGVTALSWHDTTYPPRLKEIPNPPPLLFLKGSIHPGDERSVAVVGTRKATAYGREAASALASGLAQSGVTIVSGLARGIDTIAHRAVLNTGGRTLAVLANGLDRVYPAENAALAQEIAETGAVMSEQPLGVRPDAQLFPKRNRLMSGMTLGTLVVEAGRGSGAFWTVRHALEQNREVFCVPGSIFSPGSWTTNLLIQEGAKLVMGHNDVLEELNLSGMAHQIELSLPAPVSDGEEATLLGQISREPTHIDDICRTSALPVSVVSSTLTLMELKGLVKQVGGMHYVRAREVAASYGA